MTDFQYEINVVGYAAERNNYRQEIVGVKKYGLETEITKRDEYTADDTTAVEQKEQTKKKKKGVTAFPDNIEEIKTIICQQAPVRIAGMLKAIGKSISGKKIPPKGRRGLTTPLEYWTVDLEDVNITDVRRTQFLQIHKNIRSQGSSLEYGDCADFTATMTVWTPALDYPNPKDVKELVKKIIKLATMSKFGPFRHARITFVN